MQLTLTYLKLNLQMNRYINYTSLTLNSSDQSHKSYLLRYAILVSDLMSYLVYLMIFF
jgi:hypothetical protein